MGVFRGACSKNKSTEQLDVLFQVQRQVCFTKQEEFVILLARKQNEGNGGQKMAENSCETCSKEDCASCSSKKTSFLEEMNKDSSIKKVIGIVSGKGGVGKSFVTASLASAMAKAGY